MKQYSLFYSYKNIGDVLMVMFNHELESNRIEINDNVVTIYHDDIILGYNIFHIKDIIKIKTNGMIYSPSHTLIDVINAILINHKLPTLEYIDETIYFVGEVIDVIDIDEHKSFVMVDIKNDIINTIIKDEKVDLHDLVVVIKSGNRLNNGVIVKDGVYEGTLLNGHICSALELGVSNDVHIIKIDDKNMIGKDFFYMEENLNVGD